MWYAAVVIWHGKMALLDPPAIACRSWHPREDRELDGEELELELDLHERGWLMCDCFSRYVPEGEFGHLSEVLAAIAASISTAAYGSGRGGFRRGLGVVAAGRSVCSSNERARWSCGVERGGRSGTARLDALAQWAS
jgi:hypothetical protein